MRAVVALLLALIVPACGKKGSGEPIVFPDNCGSMGFDHLQYPSSCAGVGENTHVGMKLVEDDLVVTLGNHIGGTEFTIGGVTGSDDTPLIRVPLGDQVAKLTLAQVKDTQPVDFHLTLVVDIPHHGVSTAAVPPMKVGRAVVDMMRAAAERPIRLPGEAAGPRAKHTVLFATANTWEATIDGPAQTLGEIDWIAVAKRGPKKTVATCSYTSDRGGFSVPVEGYDETVIIYDRTTHQVIDQMEVPAYAEECASSASSGQTSFDAKNDYKPVTAWLAGRVAG